MKDLIDMIEKTISIIAGLLTITSSLTSIAISIVMDKLWLIIPVVFIHSVILIFFIYYAKKMRYINFVEFLFCNEKHRFTLLPKFRIYIERQNRKNKVHITNLKIKYTITKNNSSNNNIGDLKIEYDMKIENRHLPKRYYIIFGNDYAKDKPNITYSLCDKPFYSVSFNEVKHASYERGIINEAIINLDYGNLPKKEIDLKIIHSYTNSFNFSETETDTLILLPSLYGNKIDHIDYEINLVGFVDYPELYCNMFEISNSKGIRGEYEIKDINTYKKNDNLLKVISLDSIKYESAYYVRIGVNREKMEP